MGTWCCCVLRERVCGAIEHSSCYRQPGGCRFLSFCLSVSRDMSMQFLGS
ncbi:hypothetical protein HMPREF9248_0199 [Fannyhessea vaginae PB189-T1-4]|uniref:Uncharacterized protein n=1 Tax=Fannyhessea vaginae PB189-T1-4 TaxID=866774 RepID=A0ABP2IZP1_9ACTN|nr:hypothetical protein HMPREF9248_0199 [Fannyhessea vaginae PB189-T1-4]